MSTRERFSGDTSFADKQVRQFTPPEKGQRSGTLVSPRDPQKGAENPTFGGSNSGGTAAGQVPHRAQPGLHHRRGAGVLTP